MKKTIALFIALIFMVSCVPVFAAEPVMYEKYVVNTDFSNGFTGVANITKPSDYDDNYNYQIGSDASGNPITSRMIYYGSANDDRMTIGVGDYKIVIIEADYYFPHEDSAARITLRTSSNYDVVHIYKDSIIVCGTTRAITSSDHHHIKFHIDTISDTVRFWLDNVEILADGDTALSFPSAIADGFSQFRLRRGSNTNKFAIDNLKISGFVPGPSFVSHSSPVAYNTEKIDLTLSGTLVYDSLNTDSLKLISSDGEVELSEINIDSAADGIISLYPKYNLDSNTKYTVTINENAKVLDTQNVTVPVSYSLTTLPRDREVSSAAWSQVNSGGEKIVTLSADLASVNPGEDICIILTIWNGDTLVGIKVHNYTYDDIQTDSHISLSLGSAQTGFKATAIAVTDINSPQRVGKPIYEYLVE